MEKILTIIIPTYNMELYLGRCLASLVPNDKENALLEVLVVNDGSTDKSSEIAHSFEARFPHTFRVIDKSNGHYGSCVNRGLSESHGKYVKVLDADDWFDSDNLSGYLDYLSRIDSDLVISESYVFGKNNIVTGIWQYSMLADRAYQINDLLSFSDGFLAHQILTWRRSLLQSISYSQTEGCAYTDLEWVFKPMVAVSTFMYYPKRIYMYQQDREGQSTSPVTHCRDIKAEQNIIINNVRYFEKIKHTISQDNICAMQAIVQSNIKGIYYHYLLDYPKLLPNDGLIQFDKELLLESEELYVGVENASAKRNKMTIHYIEDWRKRQSRLTWKFIILDFSKAADGIVSSIFRIRSKNIVVNIF